MNDTPPSTNLYIGSLPASLDKAGLQALFKDYGTIVDSRVLPPKGNGTKSSAMVRFASQEEATWLVENLNGNMPEGLDEPIVVRYAFGGNAYESKPPMPRSTPYGDGGAANWGGAWGCGGKSDKGASWGGCEMADPWLGKGASWGAWGADGGKGGDGDVGEMPDPSAFGFKAKSGKGGGADWWNMLAMMAAWKGKEKGGFLNGGLLNGKGKGKGEGKGEKGGKPASFEALFQAVTDKFGAMRAPLENQVYIQNLPVDTTDHCLYRLFSPFGGIAPNGVRAMLLPDGSCKGFGFVDFVQAEAAQSAVMQLNDFECPDGSTIKCAIKTSGKGKGKDGKAKENGDFMA